MALDWRWGGQRRRETRNGRERDHAHREDKNNKVTTRQYRNGQLPTHKQSCSILARGIGAQYFLLPACRSREPVPHETRSANVPCGMNLVIFKKRGALVGSCDEGASLLYVARVLSLLLINLQQIYLRFGQNLLYIGGDERKETTHTTNPKTGLEELSTRHEQRSESKPSLNN
ncbi:hypothetical protein NDU88_008256 [Pleurodeles waltl]|uniref:Uncharacterized protein n=1 Tax=Pleurodeles waltl TaxID=8319 RepID=A0AAV7VUH8_PLEWA|nr:hypothetical protein NDU88_008256 [Pleurodeles waltl]